jgi:MFS transporter, DHA2 family, multidrug resistance protein
MAIFGMGVMVGPITGPTLGGYLTEMYNWRYVFYVNLPFGVLAVTGLLIFLSMAAPRTELKFDWTGFAVLAMEVGALQLMLDRGQNQDWFSSREIVIEAVMAGSASICSSCTCSPPGGRSCRPGCSRTATSSAACRWCSAPPP